MNWNIQQRWLLFRPEFRLVDSNRNSWKILLLSAFSTEILTWEVWSWSFLDSTNQNSSRKGEGIRILISHRLLLSLTGRTTWDFYFSIPTCCYCINVKWVLSHLTRLIKQTIIFNAKIFRPEFQSEFVKNYDAFCFSNQNSDRRRWSLILIIFKIPVDRKSLIIRTKSNSNICQYFLTQYDTSRFFTHSRN